MVQEAAAALYRGQQQVLGRRPDLAAFQQREEQHAAALRQLAPAHRVRPSLLAPAQGAALPLSVAATVAVAEIVAAHVAARRPELAAGIEEDLHDRYLLEGLLAPAFPPRARK